MKIDTLQLVNFRNYDQASLRFPRMVNVFYVAWLSGSMTSRKKDTEIAGISVSLCSYISLTGTRPRDREICPVRAISRTS